MLRVDPETIRRILAAGGAAELNRILLGISQYNNPSIRHEPLTEHDEHLFTLAAHHLDFVSRHGALASEGLNPEGKHETAEAVAFEKWLVDGAPGLFWEEVLAYLKDNPTG